MLFLLALLQTSAASDVLEAERVRLSDTMRRLASRNAWEGVDRSYREMEALGVKLPEEDHRLGAQAAWALGDVDSTRVRLERALEVADNVETRQWLAEIHNSYSPVSLSGAGALAIAESPFAADQRAALAYAQASLAEKRSFAGMLPNGSYTFGEHTFELFPGCPEVSIGRRVRSASSSSSTITPVASLGVAVTRVGTPSGRDIQPAGFTGPGLRVGVGAERAVIGALGARAEVGYQNLLAGEDRLQLGYLWLAGRWSAGAWSVLGGPGYALGAAQAVGIDEEAYRTYCEANPDDARCGWVDINAFSTAAISGTVRLAGLTVGVERPGPELGSFSSGMSLLGGWQSDTLRSYPWMQAALTVRR